MLKKTQDKEFKCNILHIQGLGKIDQIGPNDKVFLEMAGGQNFYNFCFIKWNIQTH